MKLEKCVNRLIIWTSTRDFCKPSHGGIYMCKRLLSLILNQIYIPASINVHTGLGPEVIKLFSYSTQLSMKSIQLINVKMPTFDVILTFISIINTTA